MSKSPDTTGDESTHSRRETHRSFCRGTFRDKGEQRGVGGQQEGRTVMEGAADARKIGERKRRVCKNSSTKEVSGSASSSSSMRIHWERMHTSLSLSVASTITRTSASANLTPSTMGGSKALLRGERRDRQQTNDRCSSSSCCNGFPLPFVPTCPRSLNRGSVFGGLFSKARAASLMALLAVTSAQPGGREEQAGVTVPLTPDGFQYTANVMVSNGNYSLVRRVKGTRGRISADALAPWL